MKLGISGQALGDVLSFREIVKMGKKYGVTDYEIWPCNAKADWDYAQGDLNEVKSVMADEKINIHCLTLGCAFSPQAVESPTAYASYLTNAITAAKELGASVVNHYCGQICPSENADFKRLEEFWSAPLLYAEKMGITLVLENEAHDCTRTPEKMLKIMQHFNHPNFKTNFDAVNYFHSSCEGFPHAYEVLKPFIGYVHIKNACLFSSGQNQPKYNKGAPMSGYFAPNPIQYTPIPQGAVNIPGLLSKIATDNEYKGIFTLEPHTTPDHVEEFYSEESKWLFGLGFFK